MKKLAKRAASATIAAALCASVAAADAEYTLTIASWAPPSHGINAMAWPNFIKAIEEATDGRVTAEVKYNLAPPPAMMDLVLDGAADLTWIFHGYSPGRFVATKLIELPGYSGSAEAASVAYWRVHNAHLAALDEHRGVKLIGLSTHGPGQFHSNAEINGLEDMAGKKTRLGGGLMSDVGAELGLVGIQVPAPKVYETLASGAADAVMMPLESRKGFKLTEVVKNIYLMPGGFYRGSFAMLMSQETFDGLPEDIRQALDEKVFGETLSREFGKVWQHIDDEGLAVTEAADDNAIMDASEEAVAAFRPIAEKMKAKVLSELSDKGVDSDAAYEMIKAELAGY